MRTNIKILSILAVSWSLTGNAQQDKHLSMWNENASMINPAAVASMEEDVRFLTNFRLQWTPINGSAFRTNTFSFDAKLMKNKRTESHLGIGLNFTNDQTGDATITSNLVSVPIAYHIGLDRNSSFSIGIAPGLYNQSLGRGNQTWDNQWNGSTFDQSIASGEIVQASVSTFDVGAGMQYHYKGEGYDNLKIGVSMNHITAPSMSYTTFDNKIFRNFNVYMSGTKFIQERHFGISPQALVSFMGPNYNILFGSNFEHELFESSRRTDYVQRSYISYGFFYRWKDAMIVNLAYKIYGFKVGFAYDMNLSGLSSYTHTMGSIEVFLKYSLMVDRSSYIHDRRGFRWRGRGRL
jgi:type IX secretion system PorP/SprF family membrane protein